jgi:hypothetical protein
MAVLSETPANGAAVPATSSDANPVSSQLRHWIAMMTQYGANSE